MTQKTIIILLAIIAISVPISVNAMLESWIGADCTTLGSSGMIPICNDINDLNYRLTNVENIHTGLSANYTLNNLIIPINAPVQIEGFVSWIYNIEITDRIILNLSAPNGTEIYTGPQPIIFTPDVIGQWTIIASVPDKTIIKYVTVIDESTTNTVSIVYTTNHKENDL